VVTRATHYSRTLAAEADRPAQPAFAWWVALVWLGGIFTGWTGEPPTNAPIAYLQKKFTEAQEAHRARPDAVETAWQLSRACFQRAEFPTNDTHRASLAKVGIEAARVALTHDSNSAPAHFYLAMNLGQLARTKTLGALRLVDEMEVEFLRARKLDEMFEFAGPDRCLGRLYFQAPSIASVGSRSKARKHFDRAAELEPDYPENRLNLIESAVRWKETKTARREAEHYEKLLPQARARFSGEAWQAAWLDWDARWDKLRKALKLPSA